MCVSKYKEICSLLIKLFLIAFQVHLKPTTGNRLTKKTKESWFFLQMESTSSNQTFWIAMYISGEIPSPSWSVLTACCHLRKLSIALENTEHLQPSLQTR